MDTEWFAVDRCGHVALFSCGATGKLPSSAVTRRGDPEVAEMVFGSSPDPDAAAAGLFHYRHEAAGRYLRDSSPLRPAVLEDLPEKVEEKLRVLRLAALCFRDSTEIRPEDHVACAEPPPAEGGGWLRRWFGGKS